MSDVSDGEREKSDVRSASVGRDLADGQDASPSDDPMNITEAVSPLDLPPEGPRTPPSEDASTGESASECQTPPPQTGVTEISLGGPIPRREPEPQRVRSGDLYIRLEGRIYGPVQPDRLEVLLESGTLTGLETASGNLKQWTPLAYHPRIVRGRLRDVDRVHQTLTELSTLPTRKQRVALPIPPDLGPPRAAILRRPRSRHARKTPRTGVAKPDSVVTKAKIRQ